MSVDIYERDEHGIDALVVTRVDGSQIRRADFVTYQAYLDALAEEYAER